MEYTEKKAGICAGYLMPHPPVLMPGIGQGREQQAAATLKACAEVGERIRRFKPDTVVVISPHAPMFIDYAFIYDSPLLSGDFAQFDAPDIGLTFVQDSELREELLGSLKREHIPCGTLDSIQLASCGFEPTLDHGVLVPLHFALKDMRDCRLLAMSQSALGEETILRIGNLLSQAAIKTGKRVCVIASGDMSHKVNAESPYGMVKEGAQFDRIMCEAFEHSDIDLIRDMDIVLRERAAECGFRSVLMLIGAIPDPKCSLLSYEAPFGIGYCVGEMLPRGGNHGYV